MRPEVDELESFYQSREGQLARRLIAARLRALWPDVRGSRLVGLGFAAPYLSLFDEAEVCLAFMPAAQGARAWPSRARSRTALVREDDLPLADGSVDRVLLVHALELSERVDRLLREVWRVLADGGRLLAVVPNRHGAWSLFERTPFGHGRPYSSGQMRKLLTRRLFEPVAEERALYLPPSGSGLLLKAAIPVERLGLRLAKELSGVVIVEAEKRIVQVAVAFGRRREAQRVVRVPAAGAARDVPAALAAPRGKVVPLPLDPARPRS
ncbi:MAG: methyltransferase domain-containing protein [Geminicoccaceae bacterium]|nr:methyltransferase domain-containing protein [Geminicoccaceae bacterium]MDW8125883.1 methyltransferase domain-containing protein [Geminicoccaceae bacterium]